MYIVIVHSILRWKMEKIAGVKNLKKKKSNQPKMSRPPCSTSADPLGVTDPLLKTSDLAYFRI